MNSEVHILVYCPIDTLQWGSTHSALAGQLQVFKSGFRYKKDDNLDVGDSDDFVRPGVVQSFCRKFSLTVKCLTLTHGFKHGDEFRQSWRQEALDLGLTVQKFIQFWFLQLLIEQMIHERGGKRKDKLRLKQFTSHDDFTARHH